MARILEQLLNKKITARSAKLLIPLIDEEVDSRSDVAALIEKPVGKKELVKRVMKLDSVLVRGAA